MLTQFQVKALFDYNPATGHLIRRDTGQRAGTDSFQSNGRPGKRSLRVAGERYNEAVVIWLWMTGVWPAYTIDHVDLNPFNNSWSNLREATPEQQAANQQKRGDSLLKWVHKVGNRYKARVYANGKRYLLGYYDTPQEAHDAALKLARNIHGSFARPE